MLSVPCPKCGGTNIFDETKQIPTYCSFCSAHLPNMDTYVQESLKVAVDKQKLNLDLQRMDKEIKKINASNVETWLKAITFILFFLFMIFVLTR